MRSSFLRRACAVAIATLLASFSAGAAPASPAELAAIYRMRVDRRLEVPDAEAARYAGLAESALVQRGIRPGPSQYVVVVDRDANAQLLLLYWRAGADEWLLVGASPVSTGRPGSFDHFDTPLGVFDHAAENPDFRAEGTFNENGIGGYGVKGMRVFDLGWQQAPKGWGDGNVIEMRLQMHATDPDGAPRAAREKCFALDVAQVCRWRRARPCSDGRAPDPPLATARRSARRSAEDRSGAHRRRRVSGFRGDGAVRLAGAPGGVAVEAGRTRVECVPEGPRVDAVRSALLARRQRAERRRGRGRQALRPSRMASAAVQRAGPGIPAHAAVVAGGGHRGARRVAAPRGGRLLRAAPSGSTCCRRPILRC